MSIPPGWVIGNNVFIGPGVHFANDKHPHETLSRDEQFEPDGGFVEDGVVIGAGAIILPVILRKNCVVGAGAVVTKDVAEGDIVVGNPARSLC